MKKIIQKIHLWLGLGASIILFLVCLSGTFLIYGNDLEEVFNPQIFTVAPQGRSLPVETIIQNLEEKSGGKVSGVSLRGAADRPYSFFVKINPDDRRGDTYVVNQYTGEILNNPKKKNSVYMFFFKLHRWLLLDTELGRPIVGASTIIFGILLISGFYLWWPKSKTHLKNSLKIKFGKNLKRLNHDLHNSLGFYASIFLMIMTLTGLCWSFEWYRDFGSKVLGAKIFDRGGMPSKLSSVGDKRLALDEILAIANTNFPYAGTVFIPMPHGKNLPYVISKTNTELFALNVTDKIEINPYTGEVIRVERFSKKRSGEKLASLVKSLHLGDFYGQISKFIYFIACLIGTSLPITGFFIWFNKRKRHA